MRKTARPTTRASFLHSKPVAGSGFQGVWASCPPAEKIRDLLKDLRKANFTLAPGGKGSHRKYEHPAVPIPPPRIHTLSAKRCCDFSRLVSAFAHLHGLAMTTFRLRAVLYREDDLWVARGLEMDLIGTGVTAAAALRELRGNVEAQLSFATQEGINPFRPAPPEIQGLWEEINLAAIGIGQPKATATTRATRCLEWSESQVTRIKNDTFQCV